MHLTRPSTVRRSRILLFTLFGLLMVGLGAQPASAARRQPIAGRTLVFVRTQMKYGLDRNYLRSWLDRPLYQDNSTGESVRKYASSYASFHAMMRIVKRYDLDGFAFFPETSGRIGAYEFATRGRVKDFHLLTEFIGSDRMPYAKDKSLEAALACAHSQRVKGKLLITSYRGDSWKPAKWARVLGDLRKRYGDTFLFVAAMARGDLHVLKREFGEKHSVSKASLNKYKAHLRSYLDVCDGVYYASASHITTADRRFNVDFYRDVLIRTYVDVLAEPKYKDKLFGLSAAIGHYNTEGSQTLPEHGTKSLRKAFEAAMGARPDVIVLSEWDEENENTSIRPTVYNGLSTQRILRHYMAKIKGVKPTPNAGDDVSVPNLIVSYRKILVAGEAMRIELLNVPDGVFKGDYSVTLSLKDWDGRVVKTFPAHRFAGERMEDRTHVVSSERLSMEKVLRPSLVIQTKAGKRTVEEGLHHTRLRATWNWDYKEVKQSLRDLLKPKKAEFAFARQPKEATGHVEFKAAFECDEPIASAEVLEDDGVVYAYDTSGVSLRETDEQAVFKLELRALEKPTWVRGHVRIKGAKARWPKTYDPGSRYRSLEGDALKFRWRVSHYISSAVVAVPKAGLENAKLVVDAKGLPAFEVPLARVLDKGVYSETHGRGLTMTVVRYTGQAGPPPHVNRKSVAFTARVRPEIDTSVYHLRIVTKSGKTWRSAPLTLPWPGKGKPTWTRVYSDTKRRAVTAQVLPRRIPEIDYLFDPTAGAVLRTKAGRPFWASLGGYVTTITGRGGNHSGSETPFRGGKRNYPKSAKATAPTWVKEDGKTCLRFDGAGNFILMPNETIPRRAAFNVSFDIKPRVDKSQVLLTHHGYYIGSVTVRLVGGRLKGSYTSQLMKAPYIKSFNFDSGLDVKAGVWSKVEVICDQASMRFRVNGRASKAFPCRGPGLYLGRVVFGGFGDGRKKSMEFLGNVGWFDGHLASLRIRHDPHLY